MIARYNISENRKREKRSKKEIKRVKQSLSAAILKNPDFFLTFGHESDSIYKR